MKKLLLILLLALTACGHPPQAQLRSADAIMEADPDSAMALLRVVDRARLSPADSAYFALLYTQAQIKTGVYLTSDSLISQALAAYRFSSTPSLRLRAHFYAAKVAYRQSLYREAMRNAVVAYDVAHELNDPYWIAKSAETLGDIYKSTYNYPQAEKYNREAISYYEKAGKIRNHRYSVCDLATNYINLGQIDRCIEIIDSLRLVINHETPVDSSLNNYAVGVLLEAYARINDNDKLEQHLSNYSVGSYAENGISAAIINSYIETYHNDSEANLSYLMEAFNLSESDEDRIRVLYASYVNAFELENYKEAAILADTLLTLQSNIAKDVLFDAVSSIPQEYYAEQTRFQRQHARFVELCLWATAAIAIIIIIFGILLYRQRFVANRAEFEANLEVMTQYKNIAYENQIKIESLLEEKGATLARLCEEYYELGPTAKARQRIIHQVDMELEKLRTPEAIIELEKNNDKYIGGIIQQTRLQCDFLNPVEFQLIALILNKYPVRTICVVLNIKYKNFYLKKSRIVKKIVESNVDIKDELLKRLNSESRSKTH